VGSVIDRVFVVRRASGGSRGSASKGSSPPPARPNRTPLVTSAGHRLDAQLRRERRRPRLDEARENLDEGAGDERLDKGVEARASVAHPRASFA
jgi:hypothetical protein